MSAGKLKYLRAALAVFGVVYIFGIYLLSRVWPSGWSWGSGHSHYFPMILGVYATLGVFLLLASRDPLANRSLIWFTICSNVVHAAVMAVQSLTDPSEVGHLWGDVPVLLVAAAVLAVLMPRGAAVAVTDLSSRRAA